MSITIKIIVFKLSNNLLKTNNCNLCLLFAQYASDMS